MCHFYLPYKNFLGKIKDVMISFVNVFVKYTKEYYALSSINFDIATGETVAFVGPKDSGKTCIMRLIAGLEKQDKGEIFIKDIPLDRIDYRTDISMGYLPYKTIFLDKKSVYDNLKYVLDIRSTNHEAIEEKINKAIIDFKLENIVSEKIYKLTNYQKYLVSLARLSFRKLDILLVDNIFEELSSSEVKEILKLIKKYLVKTDTTLLVATSSDEIADKLEGRHIYLKNGAIVEKEDQA